MKEWGWAGEGKFFYSFLFFFTSEPKLCGHFLETTSITTPGYLRCTLQTKTWYLKWNSIGIEEKVKFDLNYTVIPWIKFTSWGTVNTYPLSSSNNSNFLVSSSRTVTICIGTKQNHLTSELSWQATGSVPLISSLCSLRWPTIGI